MADIPQHLINRANDDIVGVISRYLPDLKKRGKNHSARCPFHSERSPSFSVNPDKGFFYCFGCGAGGDAVRLVMDYESVDFRDAVERILGGLEFTSEPVSPVSSPRRARYDYPPSHRTDPSKSAAHLQRTNTHHTHKLFLMENTAPRGDVLDIAGKLVVPMHDHTGELVNLAAFSADGQQVYWSAGGPSFSATARIPAALNDCGRVILCCDYFAAWRLWWKLKGECEVRATISPEVFIWQTHKMRDQFDTVAVFSDDVEEYEEMGFDVVVLPACYNEAARASSGN